MKYMKIFIFILLLFFIKVDLVSAKFTGSYRYDIDSVELSDNDMKIKGWAAINDYSNQTMNNINPTYQLIVQASNVSGGSLKTLTKNNETPSSGLDYSRNWAETSEGSNYTKYIGINYTFTITLAELTNLAKNLATFDHFEMILKVTASGVTRSINVSFQAVIIKGSSANISISKNLLTQVTDVATWARPQTTTSLGGEKICYDNSKYYNSDKTCAGVTPDITFLKVNQVYDVAGYGRFTVFKPLEDVPTSPQVSINSYIAYGYSNSTDLILYNGVKVHNFLNGGSTMTYIPSSWILPPNNNRVWIDISTNIPSPTPTCTADPTKGDPMSCYCATYPQNRAFCSQVENPNYTRDNNTGTCSNKTTYDLQEPKTSYGKIVLAANTACLISCQEDMRVTFQTGQTLKAGTGFKYPVSTNSTRYCTAQYTNDTWATSINKAVVDAKSAYTSMVSNLNSAKLLDDACGMKMPYIYSCPKKVPIGAPDIDIYGKKYCPSGKLDGNTCYATVSATCTKDVCSVNFPSKDWKPAQTAIGSKISAASSAKSTYNSNISKINSLNAARATCDSYTTNNPYTGASSTSISTTNVPNQSSYTITSSSNSGDSNFDNGYFKSVNKPISVWNSPTKYPAPSLVGDYKSAAASFSGSYYTSSSSVNKTYRDFWVKKATSAITLEFSKSYYVQTYTGSLATSKIDAGYVYDGRKAYTDFYAMSSTYIFNLNMKNYGPNLPGLAAGLRWTINPYSCTYDVNNLIFPPKGDSNYDRYGSIGFSFRQVSLRDPFPNRSARENWRGKETLITAKGYNVYATAPLYTLTLTPATMQNIRGFKSINNNVYGYSDASNPANSKLIDQYSSVIVKRK